MSVRGTCHADDVAREEAAAEAARLQAAATTEAPGTTRSLAATAAVSAAGPDDTLPTRCAHGPGRGGLYCGRIDAGAE
ncbi:hypothetical protein GCM10010378_30740 [Streptomyces viridochromogenes]